MTGTVAYRGWLLHDPARGPRCPTCRAGCRPSQGSGRSAPTHGGDRQVIARNRDRETLLTTRLAADIAIGVLMLLSTATSDATGPPGSAAMTIPEWETLW